MGNHKLIYERITNKTKLRLISASNYPLPVIYCHLDPIDSLLREIVKFATILAMSSQSAKHKSGHQKRKDKFEKVDSEEGPTDIYKFFKDRFVYSLRMELPLQLMLADSHH